jgi:hypothetical protein
MNFSHLKSPQLALRWMFQCLLVFIIMALFLFALGEIRNNILVTAIGTTSLGSSAFLAFVAHSSRMASNQRMIGGYLIAIAVGGLMHLFAYRYAAYFPLNVDHVVWILSAAATAITMMIMTLTDLPHAPAAGLSLGMVINFWNWYALVVIFSAVILIAIIKTLLKPWLINLSSNKDCNTCGK